MYNLQKRVKKILHFTFYIINSQVGFTLIELLVVVGIIGILAAVVILNLNPKKHFDDANDAATRAQVQSAVSLVQYCISSELGANSPENMVYQVGNGTGGCGDLVYLGSRNYTKVWPQGVTLSTSASGFSQAICTAEYSSSGKFYYASTNSGSGIKITPPLGCPTAPYNYP